MYTGGHILTSTALSMATSKRLNLDFVKLTPLMLAANLIDFDHVLNYRLDDGTANSLTLHPLHIYSGAIFFLIFIGGLFFKKHIKWFMAFSGGLALHLAMDALAFAASYSILFLGIADIVVLAGILVFYRKIKSAIPFTPLMLFLIVCEIISNGVLVYLGLILKLPPQENIIYYIINPSLIGVGAVAFWLLFKKYAIKSPGLN